MQVITHTACDADAGDRTLCGLPVEGNWCVVGTPSCEHCKSLFVIAAPKPPKPSPMITLEEYEDAAAMLQSARFDHGFNGSPIALSILENAREHLENRLKLYLVGHE